MARGEVVVNREYQRSGSIWPPAARSYLIETIILGYPMPKLALHLKTDIRSRKTVKEIVDGQQRSRAIFAFFSDEFAITQGKFAGKRLSQLDEEDQRAFLDYSISVDLFVGATQDEIREVFRRINSYMVPLNAQEKRHAKYQGEFKWFMVELTRRYTQALKDMGVFSENQLVRMNDAVLLSEIVAAFGSGIVSASESRINNLYGEFDKTFVQREDYSRRIDQIFAQIFVWPDIHNTVLMKPYNFYSIALAITHRQNPLASLQDIYEMPHSVPIGADYALSNLGVMLGLTRISRAIWLATGLHSRLFVRD